MGTAPNYEEIEEVLRQITGENIGFGEMVQKIMEGGTLFSLKQWMDLLGETLLKQLEFHGKTLGYLLLLIVSGAILAIVAKAFRNKQISDMGFFLIFLLLFVIVMQSFGNCYELTKGVIDDLILFMRVLMPAYLMAAAAMAYPASAVVYYEGFLLLIFYLQKLVEVFLLPAVKGYVLISMIGKIGEEEYFSKARKGLKSLILWVLKAMIGVTAGLQMIQGMITPAIDEMKHTVFSKGLSSFGSIGNVAQNVTDVILGSGAVLKNGIGAAAAVVIISICLMPAAEVACYVLFYQALAAVAEPISDKRTTEIIGQAGEGMGLLLKILFTVSALFLLTIAMICVTTGGIR